MTEGRPVPRLTAPMRALRAPSIALQAVPMLAGEGRGVKRMSDLERIGAGRGRRD
jgi:hypothetical protein